MRVIGLLVPAVFAASCLSTHRTPPPRLEPGRRVLVHTRDGEVVYVVAPVGHGGWRATTGELVPASTVSSYDLVDRGKGAGRGALIGLTAGAVAGIALGLVGGESCSGEEELCIDRARAVPVLTASLGLVGALLGAAFGGLAGYTERYIVPEAPALEASY